MSGSALRWRDMNQAAGDPVDRALGAERRAGLVGVLGNETEAVRRDRLRRLGVLGVSEIQRGRVLGRPEKRKSMPPGLQGNAVGLEPHNVLQLVPPRVEQ